jgi:hypothetical protein
MVEFRPHILEWTTASSEPAQDPLTGYPIPGTPGEARSVPCRFHLGGTKEFRNEDNTVVKQIGRIRVDEGSEMPVVGQVVTVPGHFTGQVKDVYKGQLSWRIDV